MEDSPPSQQQRDAIPVESFEREKLSSVANVVGLQIKPQDISSALKVLKNFLLNQARQPNVVDATNGEANRSKILLLSPEHVKSSVLEELPDACRGFVKEKDGKLVHYTLQHSYSHFTYDEALKKLLPQDVEVPSSFETIGHVAHLNLRENQEAYRLIIAQVMVDKYSAIKTVVNKLGNITNEFRVFQMEVLADKITNQSVPRLVKEGDAALVGDVSCGQTCDRDPKETCVKQSGCIFKMNFGEVYWNSRLDGEHKRLVASFSSDDEVWDMFAGIGPFSVPAAKHHSCQVYANDLNPRSKFYLEENCRLNKVDALVHTSCMCARAFLASRVSQCSEKAPRGKGKLHCIMNLPASAPVKCREEFMDAFREKFDPAIWKPEDLPLVHLYAFHKSDDAAICEQEIMRRAESSLGCRIPNVRDVAPKKLMLCCSFRLPAEAAYMREEGERDHKRAKVEG
ncbi:hypothetical protein GUITHDRAFT_136964 [Guillardia theta CCMP2712]|uniref:tRNA (guanine(37)-N1)-methyltransferase n=1 Tax=Guillardia theta (strain CCMP2712) TaxID=905079 RepID=L1JIT1_GUITC|nr:hypothetical protein GUITHDRAFT_136964 [Guillardia theta CCMP2712]EKX48000.1 hypothetical protein GUITHDRAFT_136964 [Guillardia theta CCMP2712]|eukprot:XP_005834980.1 hypothetical protein GUITHDRAFT_136964 [Guillardia theta CCMP2712]